jgi:predicted transcriptional regulator
MTDMNASSRTKPFKTFTSYKIDLDVHTKLKHIAVDDAVSLQDLVNTALHEFVARRESSSR